MDDDPAVAPPPTAAAPRRRRRWPVVTLVAVVVVAGLVAGLVVWLHRPPPPVLRPAGLAAGPATANSITFHWARPATGPLPDKYLILSDGRAAGTVAGTVTSYRKGGLTPASTYNYSVVAVRDGKRSPESDSLGMSTLTPPMSQARLQGRWSVYAKNIGHPHVNTNGTLSWHFIPVCRTGACDVVAHVKDGKRSFKLTLTRAGAVYRGHGVANFGGCGPHGSKIADPAAVKFRMRVKDAIGKGQAWVATSLTGTMTGSYKYVTSATFYCNAASFKATLSGTPA